MAKGFLKTNGNVITEAGFGKPDNWNDAIPMHDMASDPNTLIGKFYDAKTNRVYDTYSSRNGKYSDDVTLTAEDVKNIEIENAKNTVEINVCNKIVDLVNYFIAQNRPIVAGDVPENIIDKLDMFLGEGNYTIG